MKGQPCPYKKIICQEKAGCTGCQVYIDRNKKPWHGQAGHFKNRFKVSDK